MAKSPPTATTDNDWKEVRYNKRSKGKGIMKTESSRTKKVQERQNEKIKSVTVKKVAMGGTMTKRTPSPKRKRDPDEVIALSGNSEEHMDIDTESKKDEKDTLEDSSEEDSILKQILKPKKRKGRRHVDFMADMDTDDEEEDMEIDLNDRDADETERKPSADTEIIELDDQSDSTNDRYENKNEEEESDDELFWSKEEERLATALWNEADPEDIYRVNGSWYHKYSGRTAPLRDPCNEFIADAVEANKGRKGKNLINPWPRKTVPKEPALLQLQKEQAKQQENNKTEATSKAATSRWKEQIKKSIEKGSVFKKKNQPKKTVAPTMYSANKEWHDKVEKIVKTASPLKGPGKPQTNQVKPNDNATPPKKQTGSEKTVETKITKHFKVTPTSTTSELKKGLNPYKTAKKDSEIKNMGNEVAQAINEEETPHQGKKQTKVDKIFPPKQETSFADAMKGKNFERVLRKYTRRLAVSFNVTIKIAGTNDGENQETALRETLSLMLEEGQKIDKKFGVLPWKMDKTLPTIFSDKQVKKLTYDNLIQYLRGPMQGRYIKQITTGRNFKWRANVTFDIDTPEIFHERWGRVVMNTLTIRDFPTQTEQCWSIGFCMGSTEQQDTQEINKELEKITGFEGIRVSHENIYIQKVSQRLWKEAVHRSKDFNPPEKNRVKHQWSPAGLTVFVTKKEHVGPARKSLYEMYGKNVTDEHGNTDAYPTWPGGAQMKFVPQLERNLSESNKQKIAKRLEMHTTMKGNSKTIRTDIKDPNMKIACLNGKSIGEEILEIMMPDKKDPVFRHFRKDWHPDINRRDFSLVFHSAFETEATRCAETLKNVLVDKHGDEVLTAFKEGMRGMNNNVQTYGEDEIVDSDFELDDDDDKFHRITVTNLDIMDQHQDPPSDQIDKGDDSLLTGMANTVAISHTSDKTTRTAVPTVASTVQTKTSISEITPATKSTTGILSELETDIDTGLGKLLDRNDIQAVLAEGKLNETVLKNILQSLFNTGTSADGEPGTEQ